MPNKYEREIEEILRNIDRNTPKPSFGERFGSRVRRFNRRPRKSRSLPLARFSTSERLIVLGALVAVGSGGFAAALALAHTGPITGNLYTGIAGCVAFALILAGLLLPWLERQRTPIYSGQYQAARNNVTAFPRRARFALNPFRPLMTRWRIMRLKFRYRNNKGR
jgi:hypothetical protein